MTAQEYVFFRCSDMGYSPVDIRGSSRFHRYVAIRVQLAKELRALGHSYPEIGKALGGRDHTTVMWYCGKITRRAPPKRAKVDVCFAADCFCKDSPAYLFPRVRAA